MKRVALVLVEVSARYVHVVIWLLRIPQTGCDGLCFIFRLLCAGMFTESLFSSLFGGDMCKLLCHDTN